MRVIMRALARFCRRRARVAAARAQRARFASVVVLADRLRAFDIPAEERGHALVLAASVSPLRGAVEREEERARSWRTLASRLEAL